jgi:hypothetical protein
MKRFLFTVIATIACISPTLAQSSSDGFTVSINLGSSPIGQAFSVGGGLTYDTSLTENLTLKANTTINYDSLTRAFGLDLTVAPRYIQGLLAGENYDLSAYAELDARITILPTPVALRLTPKIGASLTYGISEIFFIQTTLEARAIVIFNGQPITFVPIIGGQIQGNLLLSEQLRFSFGTILATQFTTVFLVPSLTLEYLISPTIGVTFEAGFDPGIFRPNTNGLYISLEGRFKL